METLNTLQAGILAGKLDDRLLEIIERLDDQNDRLSDTDLHTLLLAWNRLAKITAPN
jgi:hypothetical protein